MTASLECLIYKYINITKATMSDTISPRPLLNSFSRVARGLHDPRGHQRAIVLSWWRCGMKAVIRTLSNVKLNL
jgi:hypothetical protein